MDKKFDGIDKRFDGVDRKLTNHTVALFNIESKLDIYSDTYYMNKTRVERLNKRVTSLENR